jgi:hypothetical protein
MRQCPSKFEIEIRNKPKNQISMKDSKPNTENKANVKELALEKLRKTNGGASPITDLIKDIIYAGGIMIKDFLRS